MKKVTFLGRKSHDICNEFNKQYRYNMEVDITRRDLETTKWRNKAAQMSDRPFGRCGGAIVMAQTCLKAKPANGAPSTLSCISPILAQQEFDRCLLEWSR
ncbi:hypothetical protein ACLOJK_024106 [Asimina triloba]